MDLSGKTAIVTGAGTGIGRELALEFARAGARVVCSGRRQGGIRETLGMIESRGGRGMAVAADVTDRSQVEQLVRETLDGFGTIDLLFNNAASFQSVAPIWEADPAVWWKDLTTNVYGTMLCCRAVLPHMMGRNSGIIINMDGGGSGGPNLGGSAYGCSKTALLRFNEGLARELELAGSAVLVFGMNPGFVRTAMTEYLVATPTGRKWQTHVVNALAKNLGHAPGDCAKATMKLLTVACQELNGRWFSVDTDFEEVDRRRREIVERNLLVLRMRGLDTQGP